MSEDVYISIVEEQGAKTSKWSGLFKYDPITGYWGKLFSPDLELRQGTDIFDIPEELTKETLYCLIDGSDFGTIIWPDFPGGVQIKNFAAKLLTLKIKYLIRGIHIHSSERDISGITLNSPIFAHLFGLCAYDTVIEPQPYKVTVSTVASRELEFNFSLGKLSIGITGHFSPTPIAPNLGAISYAKITFREKLNPIEALRTIYRIESFFSLITLNVIRAQSIYLEICTSVGNGDEKEKRQYSLQRARLIEEAKTDLERHEVPIRLVAADLSVPLDSFLRIFDNIEQNLNWYRIITAEERYLA